MNKKTKFFEPIARMIVKDDSEEKKWLLNMGKSFPINTAESNFFAADNLITFGKVLGFLKEDNFVELAEKYFKDDDFHKSIIWRIHILSWSMKQSFAVKGDFIEFGCYDCNVAEFLINYCELFDKKKKFFLYDVFDNPPTSKNKKHSDKLFPEVKEKLEKYKFVDIVQGLLPNSYKEIDHISFVHLDLNSVETEIDLLLKIYDKISKNGHIIIDDYGWKGYESQHNAHAEFFKSKNQNILELPTGQGLVIKS